MNKTIYQASILSERYLDVFFADFTSLFFLVFQPIAVASCIGLVWQNSSSTPTLYFVLLFSAIFFGCINSCREIVKEKAIFTRERLIGLQVSPYILSKIVILSILGFAQTMLFYFAIRFFLTLDGSAFLIVLTLYLSLLAGTALGLLISAAVSSDVMALSLVPVFLIPQLLFSKLIMPNKSLTGLVEFIEKITIVKWGYQAMEQSVANTIEWLDLLKGYFILIFMILLFVFLSGLVLKVKETVE